jgi:hypothetical protein
MLALLATTGLVIANESKRLIPNATNTLTRGALTIVEFWMNTVTFSCQLLVTVLAPILGRLADLAMLADSVPSSKT